ncbi:BTB/POZ domain-containing protein NPY2-like isoform X2 [Mangifera indica]|nr:BTB/POZ domain-containing protein NPY2-like isoform X2 [Mangifera indica]
MHETTEKGNLIHKIDVFLRSSIFRSWKDSIIVLQSTKSLLPLSRDLEIVSYCVEAIATKACTDVSKVDWSYTYNSKKLPEENGNDPSWNGVRNRAVPRDWWVEDLCELGIDLYKLVIMKIKSKSILPSEVIGEALKAYTYRRLSGFSKDMIQCVDVSKYQTVVDTIIWLLPVEKGCVSCSFLLKLLKAVILLDSGDNVKEQLVRQIGHQLEDASVNDILLRAPEGESTTYDVDTVQKILAEFMVQDQNAVIESLEEVQEIQEIRSPGILSDASKLMVAKLIDGYLAEIAKDPKLPLSKFVDLAKLVSSISRPSHDGLYRAIDMYLKEHPAISKSERKKICKLMDCRKLSADACKHAVQNDRLPLRVVVQVLYFEQIRAAASSGGSTPDLSRGLKDLKNGSHGSSRSATTNPEEDWDAVATAEELKDLKGELTTLRISNGMGGSEGNGGDIKTAGVDKAAISKMKGMLKSKKIFAKLWSSKGVQGDISGSDSSDSLGSAIPEESKSVPSRKRHLVS